MAAGTGRDPGQPEDGAGLLVPPLVPKFASLFAPPPNRFGGPPYILGASQSSLGALFLVWGPPNRHLGAPLGAPQSFGGSQSGPQNISLQNYDLNRLGAPQSNLGALLGAPQSVWGPPNRAFGGPNHLVGR